MAIKLSLKKHVLLNISFTTDIVFLLKSDKDEHRTRLVITRNACPAMPANTSSRKSFTATRLSSLEYRRYSDLYSQDTRMYHYPYTRGRHLLTYARAYTHAHTRRLRSRIRHTHTKCRAWTGIDLAYPMDMSRVFLFLLIALVDTRSLTILIVSFTSCFENHDAAISQISLAYPFLFFSASLRILDHVHSLEFPFAKSVVREEKQAPRIGRYFHPNARQSATLVYVFG